MQKFSNKLSKTSKKIMQGFLSLEMGLVLLVTAIIIVGAVIYYRDNLRKTSVQANVQQVLATSSALRAKYGQSNKYSLVTTELAVRSGSIPESLRDGSAGTATNSFGGAIAVTPATLTGANDSVEIVWPNVPKKQCSDIISGVEGELRQVAVGSATVKANNGALDSVGLETACEAADAQDLHFWVGRS